MQPGATQHLGPPAADDASLTSGWRVPLAIRLRQLDVDVARLADGDVKELARAYLTDARAGLAQRPGWRVAWSGSDIERAWENTHAAEVAILRATDGADAAVRLPTLIEDCKAVIPNDARIPKLVEACSGGRALTPAEQVLLAETVESAHQTSDAQHVRVRSFRNILLATTIVLFFLAVAMALIGAAAPKAVAVCDSVAKAAATSCPSGADHPTGPDVFVVEVLGLVAAAITSAFAVRKLSGTSTPYAVPLASLALKLPTGALTAVLGLVLVRAGFGPTITAGTQAQVVAYAVVFGAGQQLFMQFVDKQAKTVLDAVTTPGDKSRQQRSAKQ